MSIKDLISLTLQLSLIAIVLSVGLESRWSDVTYMLRRPALLLRAIIAANVIVPVVAIALCLLLPIVPSIRTGLVLMAASPLAASAPLKMLRTEAERAYVVGTYAAVILSAVVTMPATAEILKLISPHNFRIPVAVVATFVLINVLLPLLAGVAVRAKWHEFAGRVAPVVKAVGAVLVIAIAPFIFVRFARDFLPLVGDGTVAVIVSTMAAGLASGYLLGGPEPANRKALAEAAATRHPSLAAAIAEINPNYPRVAAAIILFVFCSVIFSLAVLKLRSVVESRRSRQ